MKKWFYIKSDHQVGPIDAAELKHLAITGQILPGDTVRREDMEKWTTAIHVQGLFEPNHATCPISTPPPRQNAPPPIRRSTFTAHVELDAFENATPPSRQQTLWRRLRHSKRLMLAGGGLAILIAAWFIGGLFLHESIDASTPKKAARAFAEALAADDLTTARSLMIGTDEQLKGIERFDELMTLSNRFDTVAKAKFKDAGLLGLPTLANYFDKLIEKIDGDSAAFWESMNNMKPEFYFKRSGNNWKLDLSSYTPQESVLKLTTPEMIEAFNLIISNTENGKFETYDEARKAVMDQAFPQADKKAMANVAQTFSSTPKKSDIAANARNSQIEQAPLDRNEAAADPLLFSADEHFKYARFAQAFSEYDKAIALAPKYAKAYMSRGWAYCRAMQNDKALQDFNIAIQLDSSNTAALILRAQLYQSTAEYEKAVADCSHAIQIKQDDPELYSLRGIIYYHQHKLVEATADLDKSIKLSKNDPSLFMLRGRLCLEQGFQDRAITDYTRAIELDPKVGAYYLARGETYLRNKAVKRAIIDLEKALSLKPDLDAAYAMLSDAYHIEKQEAQALLMSGLAKYHQQRIVEAVSDFESSLSKDPDSVEAYLAWCRAVYQKWLSDDMSLAQMQREKDLSLASLQEREGSRFTNDNKNIEAHFRRKQFIETIYPKLKKLASDDPIVNLELAKLQVLNGDTNDAITLIDRAIQINPRFAEAFFRRGVTKFCDRNRRRGESKNDFDKAIQLDATFSECYFFQAELEEGPVAIKFLTHIIESPSALRKELNDIPDVVFLQWKYSDMANSMYPFHILKKNPQAAALANRGWLYRKMAEKHSGKEVAYNQELFSKAVNDMNEMVALLPNDARAFWLRGTFYDTGPRPEEGLADFKRASLLDPKNEQFARSVKWGERAQAHADRQKQDLAVLAGAIVVGAVLIDQMSGSKSVTGEKSNGNNASRCFTCNGTGRVTCGYCRNGGVPGTTVLSNCGFCNNVGYVTCTVCDGKLLGWKY